MATSRKPVRKIRAAGLGGAVATIALWLLDILAHVQPPTLVAAAITAVITAATGYLVPGAEQPEQPGE